MIPNNGWKKDYKKETLSASFVHIKERTSDEGSLLMNQRRVKSV